MARVYGLFDSHAQAEGAAQRLLDAGVPAETLTLIDRTEQVAAADAVAQGAPADATGGTAAPLSDAHVYAEGLRRGGRLVRVDIADELADSARRTLLAAGAVDLGERAAQWQAEGWAPAGDTDTYDPLGLNWAESSKFGTGGGALAGAVAGAAAGALGGPIGAVLGGIAGAAAGASVGAIGDVAGEAFAPVRDHQQPDEERR